MNSMYQQLMRLPLFQGVSTEKITALVEKLPFHFLKFHGDEQIFAAGDPCTHIKFIVSGKVRLETPFSNLKVVLSQVLATPHVLAAEYLFGRDTVYPYTAIADGPCGILQLLTLYWQRGHYLVRSADSVLCLSIVLHSRARLSQHSFRTFAYIPAPSPQVC